MSKLIITIRFLGVMIGLIMFIYATAALMPYKGPSTRTENIQSVLYGIMFTALAICLLLPYRIVKRHKQALWFFRFFAVIALISIFVIKIDPLVFRISVTIII